jgi:UDP-4-amino-4,6-dideoxy-N-acetyl-beta-L-altrosamine transaminase
VSQPLPYARQTIHPCDVEAVVAVLQSDWLTQGPTLVAFEKAVADRCGATHAVAVSNATAGLHLACLALGLGPGKRVWTSPNTFVASASCGLLCGATVSFVDIDPLTYNLSVTALANKLQAAQRTGTLPDVVVPVHFAGQPCDMAGIGVLAKQYGFKVLEDAAHAIGATDQGQPVGSGQWSDATVFSFHPVKIITTGEGGMVLTNNPHVAAQLRLLRSHGITRVAQDFTPDSAISDDPWVYQQQALGFNYRLSDLQAALGLSQLQHLDGFIQRRQQLAQRYDALLASCPTIIRPWQRPDGQSAWHLYVIQLALERLPAGVTRRSVYEALQAQGIGLQVHYIPVHTQPVFTALGHQPTDYPVAMAYYNQALTLPLFPSMTDEDQDRVVEALRHSLLPRVIGP